ncbi:hypothetical protein VNO77_11715 [Canavalia gladiata]|uniref:Uncharacterized protein n=1 Tax=Canavalia gladiata TaxID=3824 RepID=A0AAN9MBS8_CANGL
MVDNRLKTELKLAFLGRHGKATPYNNKMCARQSMHGIEMGPSPTQRDTFKNSHDLRVSASNVQNRNKRSKQSRCEEKTTQLVGHSHGNVTTKHCADFEIHLHSNAIVLGSRWNNHIMKGQYPLSLSTEDFAWFKNKHPCLVTVRNQSPKANNYDVEELEIFVTVAVVQEPPKMGVTHWFMGSRWVACTWVHQHTPPHPLSPFHSASKPITFTFLKHLGKANTHFLFSYFLFAVLPDINYYNVSLILDSTVSVQSVGWDGSCSRSWLPVIITCALPKT